MIQLLKEKADKIGYSETESRAHQLLRSAPGNANKADRKIGAYGIEHPGSTGVIYVMDRAMANGFTYGDESWGR